MRGKIQKKKQPTNWHASSQHLAKDKLDMNQISLFFTCFSNSRGRLLEHKLSQNKTSDDKLHIYTNHKVTELL